MAGVNDILRAALIGTMLDAQQWQNIWHYVVIAGSETNYDTIVAAIEANMDLAYFEIELKTATSVGTTDIILSEWDFTNNEWDGKAQSSAGCLNGTQAGEAYPNGAAMVVRFVTDEIRRQARKFIPGVSETQASGNTLSAGLAADLIDFAAIMNNDVVAGGVTLRPCVFNDRPLSPRFETHSEYTQDLFVNADVGYQRRRQVGDGI